MCKGSRYLRLRLDADQIDSLNAFLARVEQYDSYIQRSMNDGSSVINGDDAYLFRYISRPIREMASYWQGVFQIAIEQSEPYLWSEPKADS